MPNALIMCVSDPSGDPRPRRTVEALVAAGYRVEALSLAGSGRIGVDRYHRLPSPSPGRVAAFARKLRTLGGLVASRVVPSDRLRDLVVQTRFGTHGLQRRFADATFDLIVVEDLQLLPFAFSLPRAGRVVFDAREYYPRQAEGEFWFELVHRAEQEWLCRTFMKRCAAVVTVSPGLAAEYAREFGVPCEVIRSVPRATDMPVKPVDADAIRIVHHGIAKPGRKLHRLIDIVDALDDRFTLDMYLTGDAAYIAELAAYAARKGRARILPPVPFEQICGMLNGYDIGMLFYDDENFNQLHCLPNKLFEYIQARLAVAISPSPDMAAIVRERGCGVVANSFDPMSIVPQLAALTPERLLALKHGSDTAARELCWEVEGRKLDDLFVNVGATR